ncbi:MAG: hypothetical protein AAGJ85_04850 [Pseudomonadota bacterium]
MASPQQIEVISSLIGAENRRLKVARAQKKKSFWWIILFATTLLAIAIGVAIYMWFSSRGWLTTWFAAPLICLVPFYGFLFAGEGPITNKQKTRGFVNLLYISARGALGKMELGERVAVLGFDDPISTDLKPIVGPVLLERSMLERDQVSYDMKLNIGDYAHLAVASVDSDGRLKLLQGHQIPKADWHQDAKAKGLTDDEIVKRFSALRIS